MAAASGIYSVRGAGGYQMFGITPMPIYDPKQEISYLRDFMCLFNPGDIVKWRPVGREEYDATVARWKRALPAADPPTDFALAAFNADTDATTASSTRCSMAIEVIKPGLATTVQDLGRPGYYHLGIPLSGGMDRFALRAPTSSSATTRARRCWRRCSWGRSSFTQDAVVAVTGAELPPKVDGEARAAWTPSP